MITRTVGKFLRGKATPFQIVSACVLGSLVGFVPGLAQAPGLLLLWLAILLVLNANLVIAAMVTAYSKLLSLALLPVSFMAGRALLDGPTQPLFRPLINGPVTAWFGLEYYATTGGVLLGLLNGLAAGIALVVLLNTFRKRMASLEEGSEAFKKLASNPLVKLLAKVFVGGGHGKKTYADLLSTKIGNPIRVVGVVLVVLAGVLIYVSAQFLAEPVLTAQLRAQLERANGATVDLDAAQLDLGNNALTLTGLAMADPAKLETNLLSAREITADVSGGELLRKRVVLDRVVASEAATGSERAVPGRVIGDAPSKTPPPTTAETKTLEDYLADAERYRERLDQLSRWLEEMSGDESDDGPDSRPADPSESDAEPGVPGAEPRETLGERLRRRVEELGYARVSADHLIEGSPTLLIRELEINGVTSADLPGEVFDIAGASLSTEPGLVESSPTISVTSRSGLLAAGLDLAGLSASRGPSTASLSRLSLDTDRVMSGLKLTGGAAPVRGGTVDLLADGELSFGAGPSFDMPFRAVLKNTTVTLGGREEAVERLEIPFRLYGPLSAPKIEADPEAFANALAAAGKDRLAREAKDRLNDVLGDALGESAPDLGEGLDGLLDGEDPAKSVGDAIGGLFGGGKGKDDEKDDDGDG
ncbi:MAG: hypothetical protein AAGG07_10990 [Planctomycetota bacterium]